MILLPSSYEGLHPVFPKDPDPFNSRHLAPLTCLPALLGIGTGLARRIIGHSTPAALGSALGATAWTTAIITAIWVFGEVDRSRQARLYLETKGIHVPPQKFIARPFNLNQDNFLLAGGLAGILLAKRIHNCTATGWKKSLGAFSIGATAGQEACLGFYWREIVPWNQQRRRNMEIAAKYENEFRLHANLHATHKGDQLANTIPSQFDTNLNKGDQLADTIPSRRDTDLNKGDQLADTIPSRRDTDLNEGDQLADTTPRSDTGLATYFLDSDDSESVQDRPDLLTELLSGESFCSLPIPKAKAGQTARYLEEVDALIAHLHTRRETFKAEAEVLFHKLAVLEGELSVLRAPDESGMLESTVVHTLHVDLYMKISKLDWMISHFQKRRLQMCSLDASANTTAWHPPNNNTGKVHLEHTVRTIERHIEELEAQMLQHLPAEERRDPNFPKLDMQIKAAFEKLAREFGGK